MDITPIELKARLDKGETLRLIDVRRTRSNALLTRIRTPVAKVLRSKTTDKKTIGKRFIWLA